jgi:ribosomal protein S24E
MFFEGGKMGSEVAVGNIHQLLEVIEIDLFVHHEGAHHPQAHTIIENFIKVLDWVLHEMLID